MCFAVVSALTSKQSSGGRCRQYRSRTVPGNPIVLVGVDGTAPVDTITTIVHKHRASQSKRARTYKNADVVAGGIGSIERSRDIKKIKSVNYIEAGDAL